MLESFQDSTDYQIVRKIAEGGMGAVYEALQRGVEGFEKRVAIKTLLQKFLGSQQLNQMFIQERGRLKCPTQCGPRCSAE